jgi:hypothetical protein
MQGICLDQHALQIQLPKQLPEHRPLVIFSGGIAGLADRHALGSGVDCHLGNERGAAAGCGLDRAPQRLAVADQLGKDFRLDRTPRAPSGRPWAGSSSSASRRPHWRRGHWHTVLHGEKRQSRRMQWLQPVYVGARCQLRRRVASIT